MVAHDQLVLVTGDSNLTIRPAERRDLDAVFRLALVLATSATPEPAAFERSFAAITGDRHQRLLVADGPEGVVGYIHGLVHPAFHANGNIGWIEELVVDESTRTAGLGRRLMLAFEDWATTTADARYFAVATRRAGDFYRKVGYTESATYFKKII